MAVPARPIPNSPVDSSKIRLIRRFHDLAGRPLIGRTTITGTVVTQAGGSVIVPGASSVDLVDGVLDVQLPPDTYHLLTEAYSVDRIASTHEETVTLSEDDE